MPASLELLFSVLVETELGSEQFSSLICHCPGMTLVGTTFTTFLYDKPSSPWRTNGFVRLTYRARVTLGLLRNMNDPKAIVLECLRPAWMRPSPWWHSLPSL